MNTYNDLPVYSLVVNDDEGTGVDFVALVNAPAIERNFQAFNNRVKFTANEDKRLVTGPLMIPDSMIFRRDEKFGEYYVTYTAETIKKIAEKFMQNQYISNVNTEHKTPVKDVFMIESFITDADRGIGLPKGFEDCPEGTWFGTYKVNNEDVWNQVKDGTFKGFSVEGDFIHAPFQASKQLPLEVILIDEILSML
jgi:hypothetical protein